MVQGGDWENPMTSTERFEQLYNSLPQAAQREAMEFLVSLEHRYLRPDPERRRVDTAGKTQLSECDGLLFIGGRLSGDIDSLLQEDRDDRYLRHLQLM
jgi:hypothetical protein